MGRCQKTQPTEWTIEEVEPEDDGPGRLVRLSLDTYLPDQPWPEKGDVLIVKPKEEER